MIYVLHIKSYDFHSFGKAIKFLKELEKEIEAKRRSQPGSSLRRSYPNLNRPDPFKRQPSYMRHPWETIEPIAPEPADNTGIFIDGWIDWDYIRDTNRSSLPEIPWIY